MTEDQAKENEPPKKLPLGCVMMGDMAKGGYLHVHRNEVWGVTRRVVAKTRRTKPVVEFYCDDIDQIFTSYRDLREAMINAGVQPTNQMVPYDSTFTRAY